MLHAREDYNRIQDPAGIIPADEPVFLIRAQDACGAETVEDWANHAEQYGANADIIAKARAQAKAMRSWPKHKCPDLYL